ncbi:hypothetical protein QQ045_030825 [Rhodiola kirilowii]
MDSGSSEKGVAQIFGIFGDFDVLEFEVEASTVLMDMFIETSPLWGQSTQPIYFIYVSRPSVIIGSTSYDTICNPQEALLVCSTTTSVALRKTLVMIMFAILVGRDDLELLLFTFDCFGVQFSGHGYHLQLDSRKHEWLWSRSAINVVFRQLTLYAWDFPVTKLSFMFLVPLHRVAEAYLRMYFIHKPIADVIAYTLTKKDDIFEVKTNSKDTHMDGSEESVSRSIVLYLLRVLKHLTFADSIIDYYLHHTSQCNEEDTHVV